MSGWNLDEGRKQIQGLDEVGCVEAGDAEPDLPLRETDQAMWTRVTNSTPTSIRISTSITLRQFNRRPGLTVPVENRTGLGRVLERLGSGVGWRAWLGGAGPIICRDRAWNKKRWSQPIRQANASRALRTTKSLAGLANRPRKAQGKVRDTAVILTRVPESQTWHSGKADRGVRAN